MNIIIDPNQVKELEEKYVVLELDTLKLVPGDQTVTAYCVVEHVPVMDLPQVESMKDLHKNLLVNYRKRDWNYCTQAIEHLLGFWNGEVDSFYQDLMSRIAKYIEQDPGENWDGMVEKHVVG